MNLLKIDEIVDIEELDIRDTIDICVSNDNLFFANNILTHNCNFNKVNPGMEGISESIALANTCDLMCSIWQTPEDKLLSLLNMGMMKNRFGVNFGDWLFKVNYPTLTMKETNKDLFAEDSKTKTVVKKLDNVLSKLESIK